MSRKPLLQFQPLTVTEVTNTSITITWERWAGCKSNPDPVTYKVGLAEPSNKGLRVRVLKSAKEFYTYTYTGLTPQTVYFLCVDAFDESGPVCHYPVVNGFKPVRTTGDMEAPVVADKTLTVSRYTGDSISIRWNPATDNKTAAKDILYQAWICEGNNKKESWKLDYEAKGATSHTFKGLKTNTPYGIFVVAKDEAGNSLRYPSDFDFLVQITKATSDTQAPTVENRTLTVVEATAERISFRWNPATDNETDAKDICYQVYFKQDTPEESWHLAKEAKNITSFTINGLKNRTRYAFFVKAFDESGNVLRYPADDGCMTTVTDWAQSTLLLQKNGSIYCDGVYGSLSTGNLNEDLGPKLNRNYFDLSFDFYPLVTDSLQYDNLIALDTSKRVLGLIFKNGVLHATVNNGYLRPISLGIRVVPKKWQHIRLVYDNGILKVNDAPVLKIGKLDDRGNNILTSVNFSNAHAFKGHIRDLVVKTR